MSVFAWENIKEVTYRSEIEVIWFETFAKVSFNSNDASGGYGTF